MSRWHGVARWRSSSTRASLYRLLALTALVSTPWRFAEAAGVAIVSNPSSDPLLVELVTRLHGELLAVNLEVVRLTRQTVAEPRRVTIQTWLERGGADTEPDAVIEVLGDAAPFAVRVWLRDTTARSHPRSLLEVASNPDDPPEKLAIRATEVLRSALLEADLLPRDAANDRDVPSDRDARSVPPDTREHDAASGPADDTASVLGVAAGAASLIGVDGVGPAIMPLVRVDVDVAPHLALHAMLAGLGTRPVVQSATDSAQLRQTQLLAGVRYRFDATKPLQPFLGLSVGALGTAIQGRARPPAEAHDHHHWSMLFEASGGLELRLFENFYATFAGHVQAAAPGIAIHLLDTQVATTGHPNLGLSATLGAWL